MHICVGNVCIRNTDARPRVSEGQGKEKTGNFSWKILQFLFVLLFFTSKETLHLDSKVFGCSPCVCGWSSVYVRAIIRDCRSRKRQCSLNASLSHSFLLSVHMFILFLFFLKLSRRIKSFLWFCYFEIVTWQATS